MSNPRSLSDMEGIAKQENISIEDKHYSMFNEAGRDETSSKPNAKGTTEQFIAEESRIGGDAMNDSVTLLTPIQLSDSEVEEENPIVCLTNNELDDTKRENVGSRTSKDPSKCVTVNDYFKVPTQEEYDISIDERLPETVTILTTPDGGKLYLVGTAHFSVESQNDVSMIIQAVQPHIVVVELCRARVGILQLDEQTIYEYARRLTYKCIVETLKEYGIYNGLMHILFLKMAAHVATELGMAPGGEFRRAFMEAKKVKDCIIHLADRPIGVTIQRAVKSLTWWQTIKLCWQLLNMKGRISKEDIELWKQKGFLDDIISKLKEEFPAIDEVFVKERDMYLTYSLQLACMAQYTPNGPIPARVVGVVGLGHTFGIVKYWGKVTKNDITPILSVPPPSLSSKILTFTLKASLLSAVIYVGYKIIPLPSGLTFSSIKSSVGGLLKRMEATACTDEYEHTLPGVMYVVNNIPGPGVNVDHFESEYTIGCSCRDNCADDCSCARGSPNYMNGRIVDDKLGPVVECNPYCSCDRDCANRVVQNGPLDSLIVKQVDQKKGLGLTTSKTIGKGQFICEYAGEVIGLEEARRRVEENKRSDSMNYVLVVSEHFGDKTHVTCIDPKYFGNIGRYCNHSCEPNARLVPVRVEGPVPRLCLFATRDVPVGEELTFDYADGVADNSVHQAALSDTPCLCRTAKCTGYLPHNQF